MAGKTERFEMRLEEETLASIDRWRGAQADVPSRAEAIRRLTERGLAQEVDGPMALSKAESLITHLLCEIHKSLKIKDGLEPDFIRNALWGGHLWALEWKYTGVFHRSFDTNMALHEVVDVLDMWEFIEIAYGKLDKKGKEQLAKDADPFGKSVKFPGFGGNDESEHLGIARFLIDQMDRFSRFKGRDLDSHFPGLDGYRRMLTVWLPIRSDLMGRGLSGAEVASILNERVHPQNRKK